MDALYKSLFRFNKGIALETLLCSEGVKPGTELGFYELDKSKFLNLAELVTQKLPIEYNFVVTNASVLFINNTELIDASFLKEIIKEWSSPSLVTQYVHRRFGKFFGIPDCCVNAFLADTAIHESKYLLHMLCKSDCEESSMLEQRSIDVVKNIFGAEYVKLLTQRRKLSFI